MDRRSWMMLAILALLVVGVRATAQKGGVDSASPPAADTCGVQGTEHVLTSKVALYRESPAILVSADKIPNHWRRARLPDFFIIPHRDPWSMYGSFAQRGVQARIHAIAKHWAWFMRSGVPYATIDTDHLVEDASATLAKVCTAAGMPFDEAATRPWDNGGCVFGGNNARKTAFGGAFRLGTAYEGERPPGVIGSVTRTRQALLELIDGATVAA